MRKEMIALFFVILLFISGCSGITGKGVANSEDKENKINECVKLCNDGSQSEEEFYNSCSKILEYGGEKVFNDYINECKKG